MKKVKKLESIEQVLYQLYDVGGLAIANESCNAEEALDEFLPGTKISGFQVVEEISKLATIRQSLRTKLERIDNMLGELDAAESHLLALLAS